MGGRRESFTGNRQDNPVGGLDKTFWFMHHNIAIGGSCDGAHACEELFLQVDGPDAERSNPNEKEFSSWNLIKVLGPYFWPTGLCNRIRVAVTWLCVGASKGSNIMAPLFLGK
eukprot:1372035-Amorphochlora_amoeboformis.AAC.2